MRAMAKPGDELRGFTLRVVRGEAAAGASGS